MRSSDPRRFKLRPEGHNQQRAKASDLIHGTTKRFQACGVDPMRILKDHQHRIGAA